MDVEMWLIASTTTQVLSHHHTPHKFSSLQQGQRFIFYLQWNVLRHLGGCPLKSLWLPSSCHRSILSSGHTGFPVNKLSVQLHGVTVPYLYSPKTTGTCSPNGCCVNPVFAVITRGLSAKSLPTAMMNCSQHLHTKPNVPSSYEGCPG